MSKEIIIEVYSKIYYISKQKISYSPNYLLLTYLNSKRKFIMVGQNDYQKDQQNRSN